ncbi:hypothetical protein OCA08_09130 [Bacillus cereus]|nr:hypothetical protein [Bacillus cereus]
MKYSSRIEAVTIFEEKVNDLVKIPVEYRRGAGTHILLSNVKIKPVTAVAMM